jgi:hypothetical protein
MIYYNTYIKDIIGNNYVGIVVPNSAVLPFLSDLKDFTGDKYDEYVSNQQSRDHGNYHITVLNVAEYNKLSKDMGAGNLVKSMDKVFKYDIDDLRMMGVGMATKNENTAYYIVCKSEKLDSIRKRYDLEPKDFHITIAFLYKDVFGMRKNEVLQKENKFLKLLSNEYYKNENWNFVNRIENFNFDLKSEVIPVKITKELVRFKCDGYYIDVIYLDDKFWIACSFEIDKSKELPRLPETEILKILKISK